MKRLILTASLAFGLVLPAGVQAAAGPPQPIFFWPNVAAAVSVPKGAISQGNVRAIRPRVILMHPDGSWDLDHLRWSGWGSATAHATAISSASNGIPNEAAGRRIKHPAQVTLSAPGRFQGHEVYRCFTLAVPAAAAADETLCLTRQGGYVYFESTARHLSDFLSPDRTAWCAMSSSPVFCVTGGNPATSAADPAQRAATLSSTGKLTTCFVAIPSVSASCTQNWDSHAAVLAYGQMSVVGGFRCSSAPAGITCIVLAGAAHGKGFTINRTSVHRVGLG